MSGTGTLGRHLYARPAGETPKISVKHDAKDLGRSPLARLDATLFLIQNNALPGIWT